MIRTRTALALALAAVSACGGKTETADETPPASSSKAAPGPETPTSVVEGTVGGVTLAVKSAIFMWRDKADDMQIILSDTENLCAVVKDAAMPRDATLLYATIKHTGPDNREAPFTAGDYPVRVGERVQPQDTKLARLLKLDAACSPTVDVKATAGSIRLRTETVSIGGTAEGELSLTMGADPLRGHFVADFCPPPEREPRGCR